MKATTAKEQHEAMLILMDRTMTISPMQRLALMMDIAAAQLTFNGFVIEEIEALKKEQQNV